MKQYLLDTCICVFLFRQKFEIAEKLAGIGASQCFVSEVTIAELKYGAYKSKRLKEEFGSDRSFYIKDKYCAFCRICRFLCPREESSPLIRHSCRRF